MVVFFLFFFNFFVKFGYTDRFFWHKKINPRIIKFDKKIKKKKRKCYPLLNLVLKVHIGLL